MKPKTLILMAIAIVCGLGASYMTSRLLAERQTSEPDKVKALVARKNLNMGDSIKAPDEMFEEKEYIRGQEPRGALENLDTLRNRVLKRPLRPGDFVTNEDLFGEKDPTGLYGVIPPGYRAIGIRVASEEIAGGFASLPMSRVDIVSTVRKSDDKSSYSQMLLEDVLVVAADANQHRDPEGRAMMASVVTVAVKPEDVLKLRLAGSMGQLSLVLRKLNDPSRTMDEIMTAEMMKSRGRGTQETEVAAEPKADKAVPPPPVVVAKEDLAGKRHVQTIYEGDVPAKRTEFLLNENNEVITPLEVNRTELVPPVPMAVAPPTPAATPPVPALPKLP
jgi:pilus assembly protein CpaB